MKKHAHLGLALAAGTLLAPALRATNIERDANAEVILQENRTVLIYQTNGTFSVTEPGEVELLLVGGGGGGGRLFNYVGCGGGGAGGVITNTVRLEAGIYSVEIGAGGDVTQNGQPTTLSFRGSALYTAFGGGCGGGRWNSNPGNGASGGGGQNKADNTVWAGGSAIYCDDPYNNLGHNGGSSTTSQYGAGGGGGAGAAGADANSHFPGAGGDGIASSITGTETWYGGGGSGWRHESDRSIPGGRGGGGSSGGAGEDGKGGGGSGNAKGGSGILILAFVRTATFGDDWLECTGGDEVLTKKTGKGRDEIRIFRQSGTLTVANDGTMEVLAVGGGGGGGAYYNAYAGCGGGGAGGVVTNTIAVVAGTY